MNVLRNVQRAFLHALTRGGDALDACFDGATREDGLSTYRNAYALRLREAIETDHERLWQYLGDEWFETLVNDYIQAHPSRYRSLRQFADRLPDYLRQNAPFSEQPVLAELAHFERTLLAVFDAADAGVANVTQLQAIPVTAWPALALRLHPSVRIIQQSSNAIEIWKALKAEQTPPLATHSNRPQHWLVWRNPQRLSEFTPLGDVEHALLEQARSGATFADLCDLLASHVGLAQTSEHWVNSLSAWLGRGLIQELVHK